MSAVQHLRRPHARARAAGWLIAVAALAGLPATGHAATTIVEAEGSAVSPSKAGLTVSDSSAGGGKALLLRKNGSASQSFTTAQGSSRVVVRTRGQQCQGAPRMTVHVDGVQVLATAVASTSYASFPVDLRLPAGRHSLRVSFVNDLYSGCDRNLVLDRFEVIDPPPAVAPGAPPAPAPVDLLWSDEFDGPAGQPADLANWTPETGCRWGNGTEAQCYTTRTANASTDGQGHLRIVARRETFTGPDGTRAYTSARLSSQGKRAFSGPVRIEARLRIPTTPGILPAFWTLGSSGEWPAGGEIDIVEVPGSDPTGAQFHLHGPSAADPSSDRSWGAVARQPEDVDLGFHVYGVDWYPDRMAFKVDGAVRATVTREQYVAAGGNWDAAFDGSPSHFLILNIAVGNPWTGLPTAASIFPAELVADWVRVWRL